VTESVVDVANVPTIAMPQLPVAVPAGVPVESTACAVKVKLPSVVGVPSIAPVKLFKVSPGGNNPTVSENV
jgi:hypothetical protein